MDNRELIRMANQIADFYKPYPQEEAIVGIADHIRSFWEPRMRKALADIVEGGGGDMNSLALAGAKSALGVR
jgi:formate dehydrogenase subunit delta